MAKLTWRWIRSSLLAAIGVAALALYFPLRAQFDGERRRTDLSPIALPGGSTIEFKSFESQCLKATEHYSIFLPPSFSKNPSRTYPVVYFLHGLNNDETSWTVERYGHLQTAFEEMIASGKVPEFIMVHPRGDNSFYCNYIDGSKRYEDLIVQELVAYMEANFRAKKGRENRSIAGTSMGAFGALKIAMKFPDRYAAVVAQSPILFSGANPMELPDETKTSRFFSFFVQMLKPIFGDPLKQELWDANNPLYLAKNRNLNGLKIYFDYGSDDRYIPMVRLDEGSKALDGILTEAHVAHTFKIHPGEPHGWALVASHINDTLPFLCQTFR
jgi:S-formylglutathione hydrolase FrmB